MKNQWEMLSVAIAIASRAHCTVLDKGGQPYILHPMRVMNNVSKTDPELMQIAILHDVVEDSEYTVDDLIEEGFSPRVVDALVKLTHIPNVSYKQYIKSIKTNVDATLVKISDIEDNSQISRLKGLREKDINRMIKYNRAYMYLTNKISEYEYDNEQK